MAFPETRHQMFIQGYFFAGSGICVRCRKPIEWYKTPRGVRLPMDPMADKASKAVQHHSTCDAEPLFREHATVDVKGEHG